MQPSVAQIPRAFLACHRRMRYDEDRKTERRAAVSFQENLIRARKARGMTQEELAARLSISRQAVSKWETGVSQS